MTCIWILSIKGDTYIDKIVEKRPEWVFGVFTANLCMCWIYSTFKKSILLYDNLKNNTEKFSLGKRKKSIWRYWQELEIAMWQFVVCWDFFL